MVPALASMIAVAEVVLVGCSSSAGALQQVAEGAR